MSEYKNPNNQFSSIEAILQSKGFPYKQSGDNWLLTICVNCNDSKQHFTVNKSHGGFRCFKCQIHGSFKDLAELFGNPNIEIPHVELKKDEEVDLPPIPIDIIEEHHQKLISDTGKTWCEYLLSNYGITGESILHYKLGLDIKNNLIIPIIDGNGNIVDVKYRHDPTLPNNAGSRFHSYGQGHSKWRLYNEEILKQKPESVIITEGELKTILLTQYGFTSVCPTGGASGFRDEWIEYFKDIDKIFICYDYDALSQTGQKEARKLAEKFYKNEITASVVNLHDKKSRKFIEKEDVTSFFINNGNQAFDKFTKKLILAKQPKVSKEISQTETLTSIPKQPLLTTPITYKEAKEKAELYLPHYETGLRVLLAVAISCSIPFPAMLWMFFVDVPSSGKTDLVRLIIDALCSYFLDTLTQNAFVTGERATESQPVFDLLPLLNKKCFVVKDLTATFSLSEQNTKKILGDMINIYDEAFSKHSSRRGTIGYNSYFSFIGAITPATLNRHVNYLNMLGPRFLSYKLPETTSEEDFISQKNIFNERYDRKAIEKEARLYVSSYLQQLIQKPFVIKSFSKSVQHYLWLAAQFVSRCRGIIIMQVNKFKNDEGKDITYYEVSDIQTEKPWRALQQLIALAKCLAFVVGKDEVNIEELNIIKHIVITSMPADRSKALRIVSEKNGSLTAKELADASDVSHRTSLRLLEELCGLKVLSKIQGSGSMASEYHIVDKFRHFVCSDPQDFLSSYSPTTETPEGTRKEQTTDKMQEVQAVQDDLLFSETHFDTNSLNTSTNENIPTEILNAKDDLNWKPHFPGLPVGRYNNGQLDSVLTVLTDYPAEMITFFGSEDSYNRILEKFTQEKAKRNKPDKGQSLN